MAGDCWQLTDGALASYCCSQRTGVVAMPLGERIGQNMGFARTAFGLLLSLAILSGCNTTDALTPPVDVGGGRFPNSPPVTDNDLQQMADNQQPVYPTNGATSPVYRQAANPGNDQGNGQIYRPATPGQGSAPTTLQQQAASLGSGGGTVQEPEETPAAPARQPAPTQPQGAETANAGAGDTSIRFLPIIGAPLQAVTPLSRQLGAEARSRGFVIRSSTDATARHVLKGYFSAVGGGGTITVTYVWDVLDNNGARLNRIQGQENFPGNASDPWSAVPASVMQNIAAKTMETYGRWRAGP